MLLEDYESRAVRLQEIMTLIESFVKQIPMAEKLMEIKGVGIKTVSGFLAEVGDISRFDNPKQLQKLALKKLKLQINAFVLRHGYQYAGTKWTMKPFPGPETYTCAAF